MNRIPSQDPGLFRRLFSRSPEAVWERQSQTYQRSRQALTDHREDLTREAVRIEEYIRRRMTLAETLAGTARAAVHEDLNRAKQDLRNVGKALIDNNNRLALAEEAMRKLDLLRSGAGDASTALSLERLGVEIDCLRDGAEAVRDRYVDLVRQNPVPDFAAAAGLRETTPAEVASPPLPALDPLVTELMRTTPRPAPPTAVPET